MRMVQRSRGFGWSVGDEGAVGYRVHFGDWGKSRDWMVIEKERN